MYTGLSCGGSCEGRVLSTPEGDLFRYRCETCGEDAGLWSSATYTTDPILLQRAQPTITPLGRWVRSFKRLRPGQE